MAESRGAVYLFCVADDTQLARKADVARGMPCVLVISVRINPYTDAISPGADVPAPRVIFMGAQATLGLRRRHFMRNRKTVRGVGVVLVVIVAALAILCVIPVTQAILLGWFRGEQTYRGKPTSYWAAALTDRDEASSARTVALMHEGGTRAIPVLIEALGSDDPQVRLGAANVLGGIGSDAVPSLIETLGNPNPVVRIGAARALQRIGPNSTGAIPALHRALNDDEPLVVTMCIAALGRTGKPAVPILLELFQMREKRNDVRLAALEALGVIGPDAIEASPIVLKAAKEEDDPIAERAGETLKKVDPEMAAKNGFD